MYICMGMVLQGHTGLKRDGQGYLGMPGGIRVCQRERRYVYIDIDIETDIDIDIDISIHIGSCRTPPRRKNEETHGK